jgi:hypothetical protein
VGDAMYAYVPLNLPHSSPNGGLEKPNPLPTEYFYTAPVCA